QRLDAVPSDVRRASRCCLDVRALRPLSDPSVVQSGLVASDRLALAGRSLEAALRTRGVLCLLEPSLPRFSPAIPRSARFRRHEIEPAPCSKSDVAIDYGTPPAIALQDHRLVAHRLSARIVSGRQVHPCVQGWPCGGQFTAGSRFLARLAQPCAVALGGALSG